MLVFMFVENLISYGTFLELNIYMKLYLNRLKLLLFMYLPDCGPFTVPENVTISTNSTTFNTTVLFSCNLGYELIGSSNMYCDYTPAWNSTPATCKIIGN